MPVDPAAPSPRPHTPALRIDTPSKTSSKVNGVTSSPADPKTYDIKPYDPSKYATTGTTTATGQNGVKPSGTVDPALPGSYLHPHDSPSLPMRPRQPTGDAASYYAGGPSFPPPPGSAVNSVVPGGGGSVVSMAGPAGMLSASPPTLYRERGLRACKVEAESALREYLELQQRVRMGAGPEEKDRLRRLAGRVVNEIRELRREVGVLVRKKEGGRIGRFIVGGVIAGFIPLIRHFFRRPASLRSTTSKTEYAYSRSLSMVRRILASLKKTLFSSIPATVAMFVLAALYVFQAEVVLRVGKTISKRLKKLLNRLQAGESGGMGGSGVMIEEGDLELLRGWRWRVLLWGR